MYILCIHIHFLMSRNMRVYHMNTHCTYSLWKWTIRCMHIYIFVDLYKCIFMHTEPTTHVGGIYIYKHYIPSQPHTRIYIYIHNSLTHTNTHVYIYTVYIWYTHFYLFIHLYCHVYVHQHAFMWQYVYVSVSVYVNVYV